MSSHAAPSLMPETKINVVSTSLIQPALLLRPAKCSASHVGGWGWGFLAGNSGWTFSGSLMDKASRANAH